MRMLKAAHKKHWIDKIPQITFKIKTNEIG